MMSLPNFAAALAEHALPALRRARVETLQVNVGKRCDLACHHCHVEAGPKRTESMDARPPRA
jgi:MoaA/NifB/PqqE/SkfB family radical SAM enzyme